MIRLLQETSLPCAGSFLINKRKFSLKYADSQGFLFFFFFPVSGLTVLLGSKLWAVDCLSLLAENPSEWERKMFGVQINMALTHCRK